MFKGCCPDLREIFQSLLNLETIELSSVDNAMVKSIESTLQKQPVCLDKALKDVAAYKSRIVYLEELLVTTDETKRLSWKDNIPKLTPWRLHKATAKRKLVDP